VGHTIGALNLSAVRLGWQVSLIESVGDADLIAFLGLDAQTGVEAEHPDALLAIVAPEPADNSLSGAMPPQTPVWREAIAQIGTAPLLGEPNRLSREQHRWPIIDEVSHACAKPSSMGYDPTAQVFERDPAWLGLQTASRQALAWGLIRQRRSAVNMDGRTRLRAADFYGMLARTLPASIWYCSCIGSMSWHRGSICSCAGRALRVFCAGCFQESSSSADRPAPPKG